MESSGSSKCSSIFITGNKLLSLLSLTAERELREKGWGGGMCFRTTRQTFRCLYTKTTTIKERRYVKPTMKCEQNERVESVRMESKTIFVTLFLGYRNLMCENESLLNVFHMNKKLVPAATSLSI
jgi:hypothetical protein